jgi:hypothetical protein
LTHVFLATSSIHREFKLRMTEEEVLARAVAGVRRARGLCGDVEPEDTSDLTRTIAMWPEYAELTNEIEQLIRPSSTWVSHYRRAVNKLRHHLKEGHADEAERCFRELPRIRDILADPNVEVA